VVAGIARTVGNALPWNAGGVRVRAALLLCAFFVLSVFAAAPAQAATSSGAVISNGTVQLGVNAQGDLNYDCAGASDLVCPDMSEGGVSVVGLRYAPLNLESTAPGCLCEGWGMADAGSGLTGSANQNLGDANITVDSFNAPSANRAISTVTISDPSIAGYAMRVVQDYHPSPLSPNLYVDTVTVTNTGTNALTDLRYRRAMDWDIEPTAFSEWVTIQGTSPQLLFDSDDGFASTNPLADRTYLESEAVCGAGYTGACQFTDLGSAGTYPTATSPSDHGGLFDFGFGALAVGASKTFNVYYGAASSESAAVAALTTGGAQVYTLGESNCGGDTIETCGDAGTSGVLAGKPATFMFGFVTTTGDLSITKTDSPDPVQVGNNLTYSITVNNNGPEAATGVQVTDTLPAGVDLVSATPDQGSCDGTTTVTCNLGTIANNGNAHVTIVVKPTAAGPLSNTATVASATSDANQSNNSSTATTTVNPSGATVSINDVSVSEGNSGTTNATFTVSLSQASVNDVHFDFATSNGTATAPADYSAASGSGTITAGNTSTTIVVPVKGDVLDEPDETFSVDLSNVTGATVLDGHGVGTIVDDDPAPSISIDDVSVTEGNSGTTNATFNVWLSAASGKTVTVNYATADGTATQPADYNSASATLTFAPGEMLKTVTVAVVGDTLDELDETFSFDLSGATNATVSDGHGIGTIVDDDGPPALAIDDVSVVEGNTGTSNARFTVTLSAASGRTVTVNYATANGTATEPSDYQSPSGALTFAPGQTSKTIDVGVVGDTAVEPDENYNVNLSGASNASLGDGAGQGSIVNDDASVTVPPSVGASGLFCGAQHRGRCTGLKVKGVFDRPGNASWEFAAYNPSPGKKAAASAAKVLKLGTIKKKITRAGSVTVVFKLKKGARTKRLLKQVKRKKLTAIRIVLTFTDTSGKRSIGTSSVALKLKR
jgi:uncharacterized repeat protein (TIGR01451 family)